METAAVQQVESSVSQHQLVTSLLARGTGTQQMGHYALSPQQPLSTAHEAATAPRLELTTAPHQLPIYVRLGPNRGTCSGDRSPSTDGPGPPTFAQHPSKRRSHRASTEATTEVRPSARIKTRAPPRRREKRTERIAADWPTPRWSPRRITRALSPSKTLRATYMSSWRARAPTTTIPSTISTRTASSSSAC